MRSYCRCIASSIHCLMRCRTRWQQTIRCAGSLDELKLAVKTNGDSNPCVAGLRSVCWKVGDITIRKDTSLMGQDIFALSFDGQRKLDNQVERVKEFIYFLEKPVIEIHRPSR